MQFAHQDRIEVRWYFGFLTHSDDTITVVLHDSLSKHAERHPVSIGEYRAIESDDGKRTLLALIINGKEHKVNNPDHVFSYPKFRGSYDAASA